MILLTGGTGFVGRNLVKELLREGYPVRCLVRDPGRAEFLREMGCELARGDVTERETVVAALGSVDTVIHLVGILMERRGATFEAVHTGGTRNVVEGCVSKGVRRYLHISALGTRANAGSVYHRTKWAAEEIIRASKLEYTVFRPATIFGREDKFTNMFARSMKLSPFVIVPGNGKNRMQPVFVKDLVRAMSMALKREETKRMVYEVAGPVAYTFDEVIDSVAKVLGRRAVKVHVPMPVMGPLAFLAETVLPAPPVTRDLLIMLGEDNVTDRNALPEVFGIEPTGFIEGMKTYLH